MKPKTWIKAVVTLAHKDHVEIVGMVEDVATVGNVTYVKLAYLQPNQGKTGPVARSNYFQVADIHCWDYMPAAYTGPGSFFRVEGKIASADAETRAQAKAERLAEKVKADKAEAAAAEALLASIEATTSSKPVDDAADSNPDLVRLVATNKIVRKIPTPLVPSVTVEPEEGESEFSEDDDTEGSFSFDDDDF